eukprot:410130-Ditylum_brightwellii.AAC.1
METDTLLDHSRYEESNRSSGVLASSVSFSAAAASRGSTYSSSQYPGRDQIKGKYQQPSPPLQQYQHGPLPVSSFESHHSSHTSGTSNSASVGGSDSVSPEFYQTSSHTSVPPQHNWSHTQHYSQSQGGQGGFNYSYPPRHATSPLPPPPPPPPQPYAYSSYYYYSPDHPYHQNLQASSGDYQSPPHGPYVQHLNRNDVLCGR